MTTLVYLFAFLCFVMLICLWKLQIEYMRLGDKYLDLLRDRNKKEMPLATLDVMEHNAGHIGKDK